MQRCAVKAQWVTTTGRWAVAQQLREKRSDEARKTGGKCHASVDRCRTVSIRPLSPLVEGFPLASQDFMAFCWPCYHTSRTRYLSCASSRGDGWWVGASGPGSNTFGCLSMVCLVRHWYDSTSGWPPAYLRRAIRGASRMLPPSEATYGTGVPTVRPGTANTNQKGPKYWTRSVPSAVLERQVGVLHRAGSPARQACAHHSATVAHWLHIPLYRSGTSHLIDLRCMGFLLEVALHMHQTFTANTTKKTSTLREQLRIPRAATTFS